MGCGTDINGVQRMNPNDFCDPLALPLAPPRGSYLWFFHDMLDCHEIAMKMTAIPSR